MRKFSEVSNVKSTHLKMGLMNLSFIKRVILLFLLFPIFGCSAAKVTNVNHNEFPANCASEKETRIQDNKEPLDCTPPSKDAKLNTIGPLENSTEDIKTKETDGEQDLLDAALDYCKTSQEFWAEGYLNKAIYALDQAYEFILKVDPESDPKFIQQKEDLRFMISKRILEIHASRYTAVNGNHNAIPLVMNSHVKQEIKKFQGNEKKFFIESYKRSGKYRDKIVNALKEAGLPEDLSWLPLIESGFKVKALSSARALGLWQFIPSTGYKFGLNRDTWIDERLDPAKATAAAISYLEELHQIFGDWTTVLAAYNCGEGRVLRKIRSQKINYLDNFWDLYEKLPRETARYVPRFLATLYIIKDPEKYGITLGEPDKPIPYEDVTIDKQVNLKTLAKNLDIPAKDLAALNPELRYDVTPGIPYAIKIPLGKGESLLAKIADIQEWSPPKRAYVYHKVRKGETLSLIALKYHTSVRNITWANNIRKKHFIKSGQKLKIPVAGRRAPKLLAKGAPTLQSGKYTVKKGDSLWLIARNFNTTTKELCRLNNLFSTRLHVGQQLQIIKEKFKTTSKNKEMYCVKGGDNPSQIATKHNISLSQLLHINNLDIGCKIYPGQVLVVSN
ncbi:MAG: LysM peptidoglycan-binding domain-containing protein [Deltaproteobacteria bacterium]|nr:LysM peptidoglycan-binding domain-containing protein [Deltaproteobacteria bacterium]MBW1932329.1 LysM peptidoglycan-binding domain-containing protein [Deltaproteobacteria bacterium]MBW1938218.1 LysM peptidoglycan-binding domain-containing protein [Deltaproteobacteria bacterium]MBW1964775.1 LysM peptidoglycan-binding domain-containing protein [Deltaproteobacteria bacterium]